MVAPISRIDTNIRAPLIVPMRSASSFKGVQLMLCSKARLTLKARTPCVRRPRRRRRNSLLATRMSAPIGDFDRVLLRPIGALILVASSEFRLRRLGRLTQGVLAFSVSLALLHSINWTPLKLLALLIGTISGALMFVSILLMGATMCFWTVQTTELTSILYYGGREMLSYPITIYHQALQRILLFVVPLAFGSYLP